MQYGDDNNKQQRQLSTVTAPAVNTTLPGVLSVQDTLTPYERATGFAVQSSSLRHKAPVQLTDAYAPPIDSGALADRWRAHVVELLETTDGTSRAATAATGDPDHSVDHLSDYVQHVLALTSTAPPSAPPLSRTPSTPSSDMMDLTSDSGSLDDDTASSLQSPPPASPSMPTSGKKIPGGRVPRPGSAGAVTGVSAGPRIRRASTASLPGTSFSSPSVSPGPPEQLLSFPSSLSLDLDYESHDSECSQEQQQQQQQQQSLNMDRRARKQRTTRDLVDQARQQRARETEDGLSSADRRSPEGEKRSDTTVAGPTFVRPPRAPTALPRCSADIKADEDEWWLGMDLVPPPGMFHHWASGASDLVPRTPRLHEPSMPFRFGSSSSSSSSSVSSSSSRGLPMTGPVHPHQHHPHQYHPHPHPVHHAQAPPPQLTSSEDFPALPSSPPRSEPPKSQPTRKWHKKAKSKSATGTGIPTILEADEEGPARASAVSAAGGTGVGATAKRSVSGSSAGSSVAGVPTKSASPVSGYPQPPPMSHMAAAAAAAAYAQQQHAGMQGAAAYPPAVPPGFAFAAHAGFPGVGPYGYPAGVPPPPPPPQQQQPPQQQMPSFVQAQGAFGPAAQLFSMHQQQQAFGAPPTRPPGFGAAPLPPPGMRAGFAPGPPPHAVMGMYAPHTVYATAQPVGAYYSSR